jgi:NAD(P)-dependent dehydrogenase (short-subunit alcohol dehydrogenase family)
MNKKRILITGATGGIGSELATALLNEGHEVHMPVRNLEKAAHFTQYPTAYTDRRDLESFDDMDQYFRVVSSQGVSFDYVVLLAGDLRLDSDVMFAGETKEEKEANSVLYHMRANVLTAEAVVFGLKEVYGETLKHTILLGVSSWAAHFEEGHPYRADEEGYVQSKAKLSSMLHAWKAEGAFADVICEEPSLIQTPMTERVFPHLIADPLVTKLQPAEYVEHLREILKL